jgi:polysaccharide export outer membrane protein
MPVRSQLKLLADLAALLLLCTAGTGCQTSSVCQTCRTGGCGSGTCGGTVVSANGQSKPTRSFFARRTTTQEPALASSAPCRSCSSATLLRPVPTSGEDASSWAPVQRVVNEAPPGDSGGISRAVTMYPPQANTGVQTARFGGDPSLPPIPDGPNLTGKVLTVAPPTRPSLLPAPKPVGVASAAATGYPDLPAPMITHPVEAPREFAKRALSAYIIEPPDVLAIEGTGKVGDPNQPITGPHLVRPDGTIGLGSYGSVFVAGMTLERAKEQLIQVVKLRQPKLDEKEIREHLKVDVAAFNSKFYYIITDGGGFGQQVIRVPITGNETVLDAMAQINGLPNVASKKRIWIARATPSDHLHPMILPVDWCGVTQRGSAATNYQLYPGDRVYVDSNKFIKIDSALAKFLAPIERLLGATLLGTSVYNSLKFGAASAGGFGAGAVR